MVPPISAFYRDRPRSRCSRDRAASSARSFAASAISRYIRAMSSSLRPPLPPPEPPVEVLLREADDVVSSADRGVILPFGVTASILFMAETGRAAGADAWVEILLRIELRCRPAFIDPRHLPRERAQIGSAAILGPRRILRPLVLNILDVSREAVSAPPPADLSPAIWHSCAGRSRVFVAECRRAALFLHPRLALRARVERIRGDEDLGLIAVPGQRDIARRRAPMLRMIEIGLIERPPLPAIDRAGIAVAECLKSVGVESS